MVQTEICPEEFLLTKYFVIWDLQLLVIGSMVIMFDKSPRWFTNFFTKNLGILLPT